MNCTNPLHSLILTDKKFLFAYIFDLTCWFGLGMLVGHLLT